MRKIAVLSSKGGTGKTTTAVSLAHALSLLGKKVLLIDSDPQDTIAVIFDIKSEKTFYDLIMEKRTKIYQVRENLDVITSGGEKLLVAEKKLHRCFRPEYRLSKHLKSYSEADFVIMDCAPSVNIINRNVLIYAEEVIIPIAMDFLSQIGASQILELIKEVRNSYNKNLNILGALAVYYNNKKDLSRETIGILKGFFKDKLFNTYIREDFHLKEAPSFMQTIFDYDRNSPGAIDYMNLAKEIIEK